VNGALLGRARHSSDDTNMLGQKRGRSRLSRCVARRFRESTGHRPKLAARLAAELPGVTMRVPEATYLAWLDCRALELSCPAGQFFLDQAKAGLNFGESFGADYAGFARLNFTTPAAILREIARQMVEAVRRR
jgi:cystathionine beta-lyase